MKVALVTEGMGEYRFLPLLFPQIEAKSPHRLIRPLHVAVPPDAPVVTIVQRCKPLLLLAAANGADLVLVLLDREQRQECPGQIASTLEAALLRASRNIRVKVALKDRTFENWLVADLSALSKQPAKYKVSNGIRKRIEPDKADRCHALATLKDAAINRRYDKIEDGKKLCSHLDVSKAAKHSRSLRHALHLLEYQNYRDQCRQP